MHVCETERLILIIQWTSEVLKKLISLPFELSILSVISILLHIFTRADRFLNYSVNAKSHSFRGQFCIWQLIICHFVVIISSTHANQFIHQLGHWPDVIFSEELCCTPDATVQTGRYNTFQAKGTFWASK